MKFKKVIVSAKFKDNKGVPLDFPFLTFRDNVGVAFKVVNDTSTISGMEAEIKEIKAMLNREANKSGLKLRDVNFTLEWI